MKTYKFEQNQGLAKAPANVRETSEGFLLLDDAYFKNEKINNNIIVTLISLLFGLLIIGLFMRMFWWLFLLMPIFWIIEFLFNKSSRNKFFSSLRLLPAEVFLSTYPLHLGEKCQVNFRRYLKKNCKTKQSGELTFKIACLERVEYNKGSDKEVEVSIVWESQPEKYFVATATNMFSLNTAFTIPNHLPPSFEGKTNQIRWILSIEQNIPGIAKHVYSDFVFVVDPIVLA